jgi:hypothetical protein
VEDGLGLEGLTLEAPMCCCVLTNNFRLGIRRLVRHSTDKDSYEEDADALPGKTATITSTLVVPTTVVEYKKHVSFSRWQPSEIRGWLSLTDD